MFHKVKIRTRAHYPERKAVVHSTRFHAHNLPLECSHTVVGIQTAMLLILVTMYICGGNMSLRNAL